LCDAWRKANAPLRSPQTLTLAPVLTFLTLCTTFLLTLRADASARHASPLSPSLSIPLFVSYQNAGAMANLPELLLQQYHHVALPRDVPGQEDHNLSAIDSVLLKRFIDAVKAITPFVPFEYQKSVDTVHLLLSTSRLLNVDGKVDKTLLVKELDGLNSNHALLLYVTEQNSALLVYR